MKQKAIVIVIVIASAAAAVGAWALWGGSDNNAAFPEGTLWLCADKSCHTNFRMTMDELNAFYKERKGDPIPCKKCGKPSVRAAQCPSCQHVFSQATSSTNCPKCKATVPVGQ